MTMPSSDLQYFPLNHQTSEIRLLKLLPSSDPSAPVHCSLSHASLDEEPPFEALSYVWGPTTPTHDILIDGTKFVVGPNLHAALRGLRQRKKPRTVWADAICINQNDKSDQAYQVPLMGRLYTVARRTVIWFGESNEEVDAFVAYLGAHGPSRSLVSARSSAWLKLGAKSVFSDKAGRDKDLMLLRAANGYFDLLARPYWYRMWTFQEYMLPREDPLCLCGAHEFIMSSVREVQVRLMDAVTDIKERVHAKLGAEGADKDEAFLDFAEAVAKQTTGLMQRSTAESAGSVFAIRKAFRSESRSLAYYLGMTSERNYTMAHDRFYALYGIMPAAQSVSPVDYDKTLRQVVLELTAYVINVEHNINLYSMFGLRSGHTRSDKEEYPSWVPDFSRGADAHDPDRYTTNEKVARRLCHGSFERAASPVVDKLVTLRTNGFAAGTVTQTSRLPMTQKEIFAELHAVLSGSTYASAAGRLGAESTLAERWAAAASSHIGQWLEGAVGRDQVNSNIVQTVESIHSQFAAGGRPRCTLPWGPLMLEKEFGGLAGRTTFITDTGLLGLGVAQIEVGDVVAILHKENIPILLRPVTESSASEDGGEAVYTMVGTAYVSGLIDNEWLDEDLVDSISRQQPSAFVII